MKLELCDRVFEHVLSSKSEGEFCEHVAPLFNTYSILSVGLGRGEIFWRARIVEDAAWPNISDLDYPPPKKARRGRLNNTGSPGFYISRSIETAMLEIEAKEGQLVQVAGFRILEDEILRLIVLGEYANVQQNGYMRFSGTDPDRVVQNLISQKDEEALTVLYIDKFLASVVGDPKARESNYFHSRALGKYLHSRVDADGIAFPSVRDPDGYNLAIEPKPSNRVFHNVACVLTRIGKKSRFNVLDHDIVSSAVDTDEELRFMWPEIYEAGTLNVYGMNDREIEFADNQADEKDALHNLLSMYSPRSGGKA